MIIPSHSHIIITPCHSREGGNPENQHQVCHAELVSASLYHYTQILKRVQDDFMLRDPWTPAFAGVTKLE